MSIMPASAHACSACNNHKKLSTNDKAVRRKSRTHKKQRRASIPRITMVMEEANLLRSLKVITATTRRLTERFILRRLNEILPPTPTVSTKDAHSEEKGDHTPEFDERAVPIKFESEGINYIAELDLVEWLPNLRAFRYRWITNHGPLTTIGVPKPFRRVQLTSEKPLKELHKAQTKGLGSAGRRVGGAIRNIRQGFSKLSLNRRVSKQINRSATLVTNSNRRKVERQLKASGGGRFIESDNARLVDIKSRFKRDTKNQSKALVDKTLTDIEFLIAQAITQDLTQVKLRKSIEDELDKQDRRAAFIARNEVNTLSSDLSISRMKANGATKGVWRSMDDDIVRPLHKIFDDQVFDLATGIDGVYPGDPMNCRCYTEVLLE